METIMSKRCLAVAAMLIVAAFSGVCAGSDEFPDYRFHTMRSTSYYGGIHSITKDSIGRVWFSGYDAVYIYDGTDFIRMNGKIMPISPGPGWSFTQVVTDGQGNLFVGSSHGLLRYDYDGDKFELVLDGNVSFLSAASSGGIWFLRNNIIESLDYGAAGRHMQYPVPQGVEAGSADFSLICSGEDVYVSSGPEIFRLNSAHVAFSHFADLGGPVSVVDIVEYGENFYILTAMDGIFRCGGSGGKLHRYGFQKEGGKSTVAKQLYLDEKGMLWAATQSGLLVLNPETGNTRLLMSDAHYPYSLPNNSVWSIYEDPDGGVWIGTYGGKLAYLSFSDDGLNWFRATPGGLNHSIVSCFEEDSEGNLWIGTEGGGLNYWDRHNGTFSYFTVENGSGLRSDMIKKLKYTKDGRLIVSTFNGGMMEYDAGHNRFVDYTYNGTHLPNTVYDFVNEHDTLLWLADPDAYLKYAGLSSGTVAEAVFYDSLSRPLQIRVETLFHDSSGNLCLVTRNGLYVADPDSFRILAHHHTGAGEYGTDDLCSFCRDGDGDIWIGSRGGGVSVLGRDGSYRDFSDSRGNGLEGLAVFGILEDSSTGNMWFSTDGGLYCYDRKSDVFTRSVIDVPGLCGAYYIRSCFRTSGGDMLFGGTDGFISFNPGRIRVNEHRPEVFFTALVVNNVAVRPGDGGRVLEKSVSSMTLEGNCSETVRLSHRMSNFEIRFSSDSYLKAERNIYMYRMLGLSDSWARLPAGQKSVQFFNLNSGSYIFEVKAANNDGVWGDKVSSLHFVIKPSPFLSWWAWCIYVMLFIGSSVFVYTYFARKKQFEAKLDSTTRELRKLYKKKYVAGPSDIVVSDQDDELFKKAMELVERNMDNNDYDVDSFVADMAVGRTFLYQKIHDITGMSIKEFILDLRIKRASQLLKESELTISEISYMTGFANPKYFSTCFRKHLGKSPSEFRSENISSSEIS